MNMRNGSSSICYSFRSASVWSDGKPETRDLGQACKLQGQEPGGVTEELSLTLSALKKLEELKGRLGGAIFFF